MAVSVIFILGYTIQFEKGVDPPFNRCKLSLDEQGNKR